jgi:hypothetical protein
MWKKILWSEVKQGQNVFDCNANYPDEHPCSTLRAAKGEPKTKTHLLDGQTACGSGDHIYCVAWVEDVTLPRVVVEWSDRNQSNRLVEEADGNLVSEYFVKTQDSLGVTGGYWSQGSSMNQPLTKALVALIPNVGQK